MLAEIASNPAAWPLWGVLVFAALMYPLGLLLPGCACCASGCTQCGYLYYGYQTGQYSDGRLCCTGTIASSVTLRLTNIGPATSSKVTRSSGASYTKQTSSFACSSVAGDYVLPLVRQVYGSTSTTPSATCKWTMDVTETCTAGGSANVQPYIYYTDQQTPGGELSFPFYFLFLTQFVWKMAGTYRVQNCSGYPDIESCNVGQTWTSASWRTMVDVGPPYTPMLPKIILSEQRCNPAGIVFDNTIKPLAVEACDVGFGFFGPVATGCEFSVELV